MATKHTRRRTHTKAAATRSRTRSTNSDAIRMLTQDHKRVQQLFRKFERSPQGDARARELVDQACRELEIHAQLEEQIFYPAVHEHIRRAELVDEAEVEHRSARDLIRQLGQLEPKDPKFAATFRVLAEYVRHHMKEEEGRMFPQVKRARLDTARLGEQLRARREQLAAAEPVTTSQAMEGALGGSGTRRGNGYREGARGA